MLIEIIGQNFTILNLSCEQARSWLTEFTVSCAAIFGVNVDIVDVTEQPLNDKFGMESAQQDRHEIDSVASEGCSCQVVV